MTNENRELNHLNECMNERTNELTNKYAQSTAIHITIECSENERKSITIAFVNFLSSVSLWNQSWLRNRNEEG